MILNHKAAKCFAQNGGFSIVIASRLGRNPPGVLLRLLTICNQTLIKCKYFDKKFFYLC